MNRIDKISKDPPRVFEFAEYSFDASKKLLRRGAQIVSLAPKACELLGVLIENAPQVLSKEELMNQVWNDSFVEEANLTHHVSALRKALGEDKNGRKFIETIPRKGYRFVAPVVEAKKDAVEIFVSERITVRASDELLIESDKIENAEMGEDAKRRKKLYVFAAFAIIGLISLAAFFGSRLFFAKTEKAVVLPQAIVSKRLMPDIDTVNPAISPDGKFAVFALFDKGKNGVWQRNIQTGEMSQLTPTVPLTENFNGRFRFSPDGVWIYFIRSNFKDRRTTLERMSATGGSSQIILEDIDDISGDFSISPDGRFITYVQRLENLMIVDIENKTERTAAKRDGAVKVFGNPGNSNSAWSPDGTCIVIGGTSEENGQRKNQLIEIDAATGAEKIIPLSEDLRIYQIEWLADASGLIVTAAEATGVPQQIRHISLPDGKITTLTNDDVGFDIIRLSKDSRTMIAQKEVGAINIWTADANDLNRRTQITNGGSALHGTKGVGIFSDGRAVYTSPQNGSLDLWSATSGEQKQLTKNTGKYNSVYGISPDGRYIIFDSIRSGNNQVWRINADGSNPLQLSNTGQPAYSATISPDGKSVYFLSSPSGQSVSQVYRVSLEGGAAVLADERNYFVPPRFSPDGKLLLFAGKDENNQMTSVAVLESATGKTICPAEKLREAKEGIWANDSRHLIYTHSFGQELWQYDVYTDKREKIADFHPATVYSFAVSPDGKKFAFSLGTISDETVLFTNYLSENK